MRKVTVSGWRCGIYQRGVSVERGQKGTAQFCSFKVRCQEGRFQILRVGSQQNTDQAILEPIYQFPFLSPWLFPGGSDGKRLYLQCRRPRFDPWVGKSPWRRKWQTTPIALPGKSHGQRSLAGYSLWDLKESDMTERLTLSLSLQKLIALGLNNKS